MLSDDLWRRHFDADLSVVGRTVTIEEDPYVVLGVMPPGFAFPAGAGFWSSHPSEMQQW